MPVWSDREYTLRSLAGSLAEPVYPMLVLGGRKARRGPWGTHYLPHLVWVPHDEHGKLPDGCEGEWEV